MKYVIVCLFFAFFWAPLHPAESAEPFRASRLTEVDEGTVVRMLKTGPPGDSFFHLVDLRTEAKYREAHISGAVNIPRSKFSFLAEKFFSLNDKIVLYGQSKKDPSSVNTAVDLMNRGYTYVTVLKGGFEEWGGPTERLKKNRK